MVFFENINERSFKVINIMRIKANVVKHMVSSLWLWWNLFELFKHY